MHETCSIPVLGRSPGEGNGNPLQYSCLKNPMDSVAWRATVHSVTKSWTKLKGLSTHAHVPSMTFWRVFIINWCWILSKIYCTSIEMIILFLFFNWLVWYITLIDLQNLKNPCIPGMNSNWSWCVIFQKYCWIQIVRILLRSLASIFINAICL